MAYSEDGREQAGMGLAMADYNGDGKIDFVKTLFADEIPALYLNEGEGNFADISVAAGLNGMTQHVQWGAGFVDLTMTVGRIYSIRSGIFTRAWSSSIHGILIVDHDLCSRTCATEDSLMSLSRADRA